MNKSLFVIALSTELRRQASPIRARVSQSFFKTGPGQYGEGDQFLGVSVPNMRIIAKKFQECTFAEIEVLLQSPWHEERFMGVLLLVSQFKQAKNSFQRKECFVFYLRHTDCINNWDLVDASAYHLVGEWLIDKPRTPLTRLAHSTLLWERRIAIVSTFAFIRRGESLETLRIAKILLKDDQELIHKAVGWMLREVGKRCGTNILQEFLRENIAELPRVTLRYAIERFPKEGQKRFLQKDSR